MIEVTQNTYKNLMTLYITDVSSNSIDNCIFFKYFDNGRLMEESSNEQSKLFYLDKEIFISNSDINDLVNGFEYILGVKKRMIKHD